MSGSCSIVEKIAYLHNEKNHRHKSFLRLKICNKIQKYKKLIFYFRRRRSKGYGGNLMIRITHIVEKRAFWSSLKFFRLNFRYHLRFNIFLPTTSWKFNIKQNKFLCFSVKFGILMEENKLFTVFIKEFRSFSFNYKAAVIDLC